MHLAIVAVTLLCAITTYGQPSSSNCKIIPGDKAWPSKAEWDNFNQTVGGRLVATVPLGSACHGPTFNNATCENLKSQWQTERIQYVIF
jgi:hypothetical protein